jgi:hypothetical protein
MRSIRRGLALLRASGEVFGANPGLMLYPLASIASFFATIVFILTPVGLGVGYLSYRFLPLSPDQLAGNGPMPWPFYLLMAAYFALLSWIVIFINSAFYLAADAALQGERMTFRQSMAAAWSHRKAITQWALVSMTVGVVLRTLEQRLSFVGSWIVRLIGVAWSMATVFAIPVLVSRDTSPKETVMQSAQLFRTVWGENTVSDVSVGVLAALALLFTMILPIPILLTAVFAGRISGLTGIVIGIFCGLLSVGVLIVTSAVQTVFTAALYRFASTGDYVGPFPQEILQGAYAPKKRFSIR